MTNIIALFFVVMAIVFVIYGLSNNRENKAALLLAALSIIVSIGLYFLGGNDASAKTPEKTTNKSISLINSDNNDIDASTNTTIDNSITTIIYDYFGSSADPQKEEASYIDSSNSKTTTTPFDASSIPAKPQSPYVKALKKELAGDASYSDEKKMDFILDTYDTRKDDSGENQEWYHSTPIYDETTGYNLAVYYADDMPFFIDVRTNGEGVLKLYYWGDELLMCYDKRGSSRVESYKDSEIYQAVAEEFAHVYELACKAA